MTEVDVKSPQSSALDQSKQPDPAGHEQDQSHFVPQGPSGQPFPPPNFAFYTYPPSHPPPPPPADGPNPDPNAPPAGSGAGEPIPYPGIYPYVYHQPPPPGYMPVSMSGMPIPSAIIKPKRKQVKMACTNCAAACKRCDVSRPCERCIKYGLSDSCHDGVRKERKKGFKRGPYNKRKRQDDKETSNWDAAATQANPNGEWTPGTAAPPFPPQAPFPPPPEGYYPAFYALGPPPPGPGHQLIAVPHNGAHGEHPEGQPDGAVDPNHPTGENGHPPHGQPPFAPHPQFVYPHLPPGAYPFGYPFPGPPPPPPPHHPPPQQQSTQAQQQQQHQLPTIPTDELLEDTEPRAQQDPQEQSGQSQSQGQNREDSQQPSSNNNNGDANNIQNATKKKRASAVAAEEVVKEDDDEDDDSSTPPKKKRGRRPSDGDWSATSKRKANGGARARRTARRQAQAEEEGHAADLQLEADNTQITEVITDQDIVGSSENSGTRS